MRIETEALREDAVPGYPEEAFSSAVNNELIALFEREIQGLPEKQAFVIRERFMGARPVRSLSYRVLGREMGCSHENVRMLEIRGLENLRESLGFLEKEFDGPEGQRSEVRVQRLVHNRVAGRKGNWLSKEQYDSMTPEQRKARKQENGHRWYLKHRERKLAENKQEYKEDKLYHYWRDWKWRQKNLESYRKYQREYQKQRCEDMDDGYITELFRQREHKAGYNLTRREIKVERECLKLMRLLKRKGK